MSAPRTPARDVLVARLALAALRGLGVVLRALGRGILGAARWSVDRKSTRLNSSHD